MAAPVEKMYAVWIYPKRWSDSKGKWTNSVNNSIKKERADSVDEALQMYPGTSLSQVDNNPASKRIYLNENLPRSGGKRHTRKGKSRKQRGGKSRRNRGKRTRRH
jgi:hypothetical protein